MNLFKKFLGMALVIALSTVFFPQNEASASGDNKCLITAHESAETVDTFVQAPGNKHYIVESGGHLNLTSSGATVFVEDGGKVSGAGDGFIYVKKGGVIEMEPMYNKGGNNVIYYEDASSLVYVGDYTETVKCEVLKFIDPESKSKKYCILPMPEATKTVEDYYSMFYAEKVGEYINYISHSVLFNIKDGGLLESGWHNRLMFIEKGGKGVALGPDNVFVKAGGTFELLSGGMTNVYVEKGAEINKTAENGNVIRCDEIDFYPAN